MVCGGPASGRQVFRPVETSLGTASPSPAATRMLLQVAAVPAWWQTPNNPFGWPCPRARHLSLGKAEGQCLGTGPAGPGSVGEGRCSRGDAQSFGGSEPGRREVWENLLPTVGSELSSNSCQVLPEPWSLCPQPLAHFGAERALPRDKGAPGWPLLVSPPSFAVSLPFSAPLPLPPVSQSGLL